MHSQYKASLEPDSFLFDVWAITTTRDEQIEYANHGEKPKRARK